MDTANPFADDAEITEMDDGSVEVNFDSPDEENSETVPVDSLVHSANLALFLEDEDLSEIQNFCSDRYLQDKNSSDEFFNIIADGLSRMGMAIEDVSEPFPGASPVTHPIVLESALKSQAKIMGEIFSGKGLVDTYINSKSDLNTLQRANRIKKYMDFQYLYQMDEFIPETEKLTFRYALTGNAYRKYYYDAVTNRVRTKFLPEDKFIINSNCTTIKDSDFYTELYTLNKHEVEKLIADGEFVDIFNSENDFNKTILIHTPSSEIESEITAQTGDALGYSNGESSIRDKYSFRDYHCYLRMPDPIDEGEDRSLPYIVTAEESSEKIVSIRRNWDEKDPIREKLVWHAHYKLIPGLGFHGIGYIHILGNFQFALTQMMRSIIDAGQYANLNGGFRAKGIRFTKDANVPLRFGEFREIDTHGKNINEVIMPLDFREPSQVLKDMFSQLDARVQRFADSTEQVIADSTNYGAVGTTMALLEASAKFMSGILKRFYNTLTEEFRILYRLNGLVLDDSQTYYLKGEENNIGNQDFIDGIDVVPHADPNISSSAHRIAMAQAKLTAAQQDRDIHDMREAYIEFYAALGMEQDEIDRLIPPLDEAQPQDPLSDIISASHGKPIKAFDGQDHDAHIQFKSAFLNDPQGGASQVAASIVPIIQANIAEHTLLKYVSRIKGAMQLVDQSQVGAELAQAQAAELVANANRLEHNQMLLSQNDPAMILAMAEQENAQVRKDELEHKKLTDFQRLQQAKRDQDIKMLKLAKDADLNQLKIEAGMAQKKMELGSKMVSDALNQKQEPKKPLK